MRSRLPHSQGGAYSAFQCQSNVGVLPSPQDISTAPVPVVQPENGIQNSMVAARYCELRAAYTPAKQPGYAQSQQNFQELHHHQESQASKVSTGLQYQLPTDSKYTSWKSHHQTSREDNAEFPPSAHVSTQRSSYFVVQSSHSPMPQSVYNSEEQRECHRQNFGRHSVKESDLNKNPGLLQRHLNSASSTSTTATGNKVFESCPMLTVLLKGNESDSKYSTTSSSSSEETNANSEVITITNLSDERHCKAQQVKGSSLKCGWTRTQNLDNSGGAPSTPHQQQVMIPSLSTQSSAENVRLVRKTEPPTDDDILDYIAKSIAESQTILTQKNRKHGHSSKDSDRVYSLQPDSTVPKVKSVAHLPTTSAPDKEYVKRQSLSFAVTEQNTSAVGQELEGDSSKGIKTNAEFTKRAEETGDCAASASEKHSTEYPQIMREVAVTCTKNENESQVVLTSMPGMTWDDLTEKQTSLTLKCSMSQEQNNSLWSNSKDLDTKVEVPDDREPYMPERQSGALKLVEAEELDSVQSITDISEDLQTKSNLEQSKVCSLACAENLIYEDISEDESQQIECISGEMSSSTQAPEPNFKQLAFENEPYGLVQGQALMTTDIISDEELIPKEQISPKIEALIVAQQYSKTDPGFEGQLCPKYDSEQQENHSISCSPYPILKDGEETDDEMDDDWLIIPVVVSDLNFEANEQDQDSPQELLDVGKTWEQEQQCDTSPRHWPSPNPEVSAFSPLEVFETLATLQQKTAMEIKTVVDLALGRSTPDREMDSEGEPFTPQNRRESVDSCETEDSLDYSPELERNYMTVSKKLLESSAPLPSETDVVLSANEGVSTEVTDTQKVQTSYFNKSSSLQRLGELIKVKAASKRVNPKTSGKKISKKDEIGSDLEDECDQNCKKKAKRKRFFSSSSDDSEDAGNSQCETVEKNVQNNSLPSRDLAAQQHQSKHYNSSFADLSHSTKQCGQMIGTKAASEHVRHNGQNVSKEEIITIHDTDSEDDSDDNSCVEETRETPETEDSECETAEGETQLSFTDSALSQHPSKLYDAQYEEVMQDACSDVSYSVKKSGQLIEAKGECEHVQNTTNRQRTLKRTVTFCDSDKVVKKSLGQKKANTQELLLSESEDIGDDLVSSKNSPSTEIVGHLCRTGNAQPHKNRLSSKDLPEKQCQSVDKESNSTLDPHHLIPLVVKPPLPAEKILKQVEKRALPPKTKTSKKPDTCEKNKPHLYRNKQGRFVPKPQPENDKHHTKENNIQAKVLKSRTASRQLPLPSQDSPSTSLRSLPSTSGQLPEARQRSAFLRNMSLPVETTSSGSAAPSKQSSSQHLSSSKLHRSHSTPSTLNPFTNTIGPSLVREKLVKRWKDGYAPVTIRTRRNEKTSLGMKEDLRFLKDSLREARPGPSHCDRVPKQRNSSQKATPPLMKRSRTEAIQRTNDIHRDPTVKLKSSVGRNYKWKNGDKANERIELDWEDK